MLKNKSIFIIFILLSACTTPKTISKYDARIVIQFSNLSKHSSLDKLVGFYDKIKHIRTNVAYIEMKGWVAKTIAGKYLEIIQKAAKKSVKLSSKQKISLFVSTAKFYPWLMKAASHYNNSARLMKINDPSRKNTINAISIIRGCMKRFKKLYVRFSNICMDHSYTLTPLQKTICDESKNDLIIQEEI